MITSTKHVCFIILGAFYHGFQRVIFFLHSNLNDKNVSHFIGIIICFFVQNSINLLTEQREQMDVHYNLGSCWTFFHQVLRIKMINIQDFSIDNSEDHSGTYFVSNTNQNLVNPLCMQLEVETLQLYPLVKEYLSKRSKGPT